MVCFKTQLKLCIIAAMHALNLIISSVAPVSQFNFFPWTCRLTSNWSAFYGCIKFEVRTLGENSHSKTERVHSFGDTMVSNAVARLYLQLCQDPIEDSDFSDHDVTELQVRSNFLKM